MIEAETLELLEWHRLCQHLATFAATPWGIEEARNLPVPTDFATTQTLLRQTQEVEIIDHSLKEGWKFAGIGDLRPALSRAGKGGMLSGEELLDVAQTLAVARRLRRVIEEQEPGQVPTLLALVAEIRTYPELEQDIHHCIDEGGKVADRASPKLGELREKSRTLREQIYQKLNRLIQRQPLALQEAVITQRGDRHVIPVKAGYKEQIPGVVQDISSTGATLYIEPQIIVEVGNQLRQTRRQELREEEIILRRLSEAVGDRQPELEHLLVVVTQLDLATARLRYSLWLGANPPQFLPWPASEPLQLRQLRHPLLVWQEKHQNGPGVVPISLQIDPPIRVITITGPNTGGKTVTLKTLGLAALMAKVGLYLPAKEPVLIPWFEKILADIGDEQSLEQNLSTFSGHIRRISRILAVIPTDLSPYAPILVLLDEVGAGTDPIEGTALAIALLQSLAAQVQLTLATTHYGELKALKYQDERFENASVEFDDQTLSPTYRLLWGIPGRSNALAIAQRLGLRADIVQRAQGRLGQGATNVNEVIAGLEQQRREQESKAQQAQKLLQEAEIFHEELLIQSRALREQERQLQQHQQQAVQAAIDAAKAEIAQVIRQLQRGQPTAQKAHQATMQLERLLQEQKAPPPLSQNSYIPQMGERVRIPSLGQTATVVSLEKSQAEVTVKLGLMKMTLPMVEIESLDGKKVAPTEVAPPPPPPPNSRTPILLRSEKNTLDLRGDRVEEAESKLEAAIAKAQDFDVLWIIHGKGTGRLRQGVHEFLSHHPQIQSFQLAPANEGGAGVTMAYFHCS